MSHRRSFVRSRLPRRIVGCGILLGALMLSSVVGAAATPVAGTTTFTDPNGRYAFQVPQEWQAAQTGAQGTLAAWQSLDPPGNFQVSTAPLAAGTTLDDFGAQLVKSINAYYPDANVDASKAQSLTLGGLPARRLDYSGTTQGTRFQLAQFFLVQGTTGYSMNAVALPSNFGRFMDRVRVVLDSFTVPHAAAPASRGGRDKGTIVAFILLLIAMLALIGLLLWRRNHPSRRARRDITGTQPMAVPPTGASAPPGVPVASGSPTDTTDLFATHAMPLNGPTAADTPPEGEPRYHSDPSAIDRS
jgi:hypothetical protein